MNQENNSFNNDIFHGSLNIPKGKEDVSELLDQLKDGVNALMNSDHYKEYLNYLSSFYHYSFRNVLLMLVQNPEATNVGSFTFWKQHNRFVKKGEHGMKILAPCIYKVQKEEPIIGTNGQPIKDADGKEKTHTVSGSQIKGFRIATVFDISQTEGEEIPNILKQLEKNTPVSKILIDTISQISVLPIEYKELKGQGNGYMDGKNIVIKKDLSLDQTAKTMIHEYTHSIYHIGIKDYQQNRSAYEIQAESTAYIVAKHFGLDTSEYTFGYVTGWAEGKSLDQYQDSLKKINDMSTEIIDKIETHLENEYEKIQVKEKEDVKKQLSKAKLEVSPDLVDKIVKLNHASGKKNTITQIKQIAKTDSELGEAAKQICNSFNQLSKQKDLMAQIEP